jgi:hypothetical protein
VTWTGDLRPFAELFVLDFVRDPSIIVEQGKRNGITQNYVSEISAWCVELNEQLKLLAAEHGIELQLMGGNAASLRLDAAAQRGSSDNDYLTTASEAQVEALVAALESKFAGLVGELFKPKRMPSAGKLALPLVAYTLTVPSLTIGNRETLEAKIEFHLEEELPPGQPVTGTPFAVGQELTTRVPALPYQLGLKIIVLDDPPVGIPPERRDVIPRQLHDIDHLVHLMVRAEDWDALAPYVRRRYEKERRFQGLQPEDEAPWAGIDRRLAEWAESDDPDDDKATVINNFQTGQIGKTSRRSPAEWRARARRLSVVCRCARLPDPGALYEGVLAAETRIDVKLSGRPARALRQKLAGATDAGRQASGRKASERHQSARDVLGGIGNRPGH